MGEALVCTCMYTQTCPGNQNGSLSQTFSRHGRHNCPWQHMPFCSKIWFRELCPSDISPSARQMRLAPLPKARCTYSNMGMPHSLRTVASLWLCAYYASITHLLHSNPLPGHTNTPRAHAHTQAHTPLSALHAHNPPRQTWPSTAAKPLQEQLPQLQPRHIPHCTLTPAAPEASRP